MDINNMHSRTYEEPEDDTESLRDTEYQIRRMEDAIEELVNCSTHIPTEDIESLYKEWAEIKKILRNEHN